MQKANSRRSGRTLRLGIGATFLWQSKQSTEQQNYKLNSTNDINKQNWPKREHFKRKRPHFLTINSIISLKLVNSSTVQSIQPWRLLHFNMAVALTQTDERTRLACVWSPYMPQTEVKHTEPRQLHDVVQALRRYTRTPVQVYRLQVEESVSQRAQAPIRHSRALSYI